MSTNISCPYCNCYLTLSYLLDISTVFVKNDVVKFTPTVECDRGDHSYFAEFTKILASNKKINNPKALITKSKMKIERIDLYSKNTLIEVINDYTSKACEIYSNSDLLAETAIIKIDSRLKENINIIKIFI